MALILNIDTSTETAGVSISRDGELIVSMYNQDQRDHASWLHPAIQSLMGKTAKSLNDLNAVAVTSGPGSYTGLRVGMSAAKGLCYALGIPLITESTLAVMALAALDFADRNKITVICPMIDARRMEVFTAAYSSTLQELKAPAAMILDASSFSDLLQVAPIYFLGTGAAKFAAICNSSNAHFGEMPQLCGPLGLRAEEKFLQQNFADHNLAEPAYIKEFNSHIKIK